MKLFVIALNTIYMYTHITRADLKNKSMYIYVYIYAYAHVDLTAGVF